MSEIISQIMNFITTPIPAYLLIPPFVGSGIVAAIAIRVPHNKLSANLAVPKVETEESEDALANIMIARIEADANDKKAEKWLTSHNYARN